MNLIRMFSLKLINAKIPKLLNENIRVYSKIYAIVWINKINTIISTEYVFLLNFALLRNVVLFVNVSTL